MRWNGREGDGMVCAVHAGLCWPFPTPMLGFTAPSQFCVGPSALGPPDLTITPSSQNNYQPPPLPFCALLVAGRHWWIMDQMNHSGAGGVTFLGQHDATTWVQSPCPWSSSCQSLVSVRMSCML